MCGICSTGLVRASSPPPPFPQIADCNNGLTVRRYSCAFFEVWEGLGLLLFLKKNLRCMRAWGEVYTVGWKGFGVRVCACGMKEEWWEWMRPGEELGEAALDMGVRFVAGR